MSAQVAAAERLNALPRKVQLPLRELLAVGHVNDETVNFVLDATELAGSPEKALGFTVGFLHLQSQGVPVKDVIRMSRAQGRRVRLDWSASRWQQEHDRLSRIETLKRLAEENVHYAVDDIKALLPANLRGYVISSSRRLGMEGLRQRHCVASYHAQIRAGHSAIATVFIDRRRWTVQLMRTGSAETPLRILQVRSRRNQPPTQAIMEAIYWDLGIEPERVANRDVSSPARTYMANLRRILPVLREYGVTDVTVSFDGSGDSGSVSQVVFNGAQIDASSMSVEVEAVHRVLEEGEWVDQRSLETTDLNTAIEALTNDYLEETGVNWYDNDGGFGDLTINVQEGTVALEVRIRFTASECEFECKREIASGEEV